MIRVIPSRLLLGLGYMAVVFGLSSIPGRQVASLGFSSTLVSALHVPLFAGLAWVTLYSVRGPRALRIAVVAVTCMAYAISDEWHQSFVPGRHFSLGDIGLDAVGMVLGIVAGAWVAAGLDPGSRTLNG